MHFHRIVFLSIFLYAFLIASSQTQIPKYTVEYILENTVKRNVTLRVNGILQPDTTYGKMQYVNTNGAKCLVWFSYYGGAIEINRNGFEDITKLPDTASILFTIYARSPRINENCDIIGWDSIEINAIVKSCSIFNKNYHCGIIKVGSDIYTYKGNALDSNSYINIMVTTTNINKKTFFYKVTIDGWGYPVEQYQSNKRISNNMRKKIDRKEKRIYGNHFCPTLW